MASTDWAGGVSARSGRFQPIIRRYWHHSQMPMLLIVVQASIAGRPLRRLDYAFGYLDDALAFLAGDT